MELVKGLKFIQDNSLQCEVLQLYSDKIRTSKRIVSNNMITILRNGKEFNYNLTCFQKSFDTGLAFGSFKVKGLETKKTETKFTEVKQNNERRNTTTGVYE